MSITTPVRFERQPGPIGKPTTKDSTVRRVNVANFSGETIAYGSMGVIVDRPNDSQLAFNPGVRKVQAGDTVDSRLCLIEYQDRSSNANFSDGLQYLDANGFRGLPNTVTGPVMVDGEMWVYSETPITSINDPVYVRVVDGTLPAEGAARSFSTVDLLADGIDVSAAFEWFSVTAAPGPARLRIKK